MVQVLHHKPLFLSLLEVESQIEADPIWYLSRFLHHFMWIRTIKHLCPVWIIVICFVLAYFIPEVDPFAVAQYALHTFA